MKWLLLILLLLAFEVAAQPPRSLLPGGSVVLQPGYRVETVSKTRAIIQFGQDADIHFESAIGPSMAPRLTDKGLSLCRWSRASVIDGRKVLMGIWKDRDTIVVSIYGKHGDSFRSANFEGEFDRVEEVGDLILMALSFEPAK